MEDKTGQEGGNTENNSLGSELLWNPGPSGASREGRKRHAASDQTHVGGISRRKTHRSGGAEHGFRRSDHPSQRVAQRVEARALLLHLVLK